MVRTARGFTLLEILIALAIFSIGVLALVPLFGTARSHTKGSREVTAATELARTYVDKLRNAPFNNIGPCDPGNPNNPNSLCTPPTSPTDEVAANLPYTVVWTVRGATGGAYTFGTPPSPNMKRIEVVVTCPTCTSRRLRDTSATGGIRMTTLVSERS